ncbi:MAG: ammonium transporter [Chthonomonadaceae bacterium]|nr:ammonium transporter [Chthonomonadaceae bacterium]
MRSEKSRRVSPENLTRYQKIGRLAKRLQDPEWRRYGYTLLVGKFGAVAMLLMAYALYMAFAGNPAHAQAAAATPPMKAEALVNPLNTLWVLLAAFLVFGMQVGFTMLEAGFCRSRETVNVLMECIVDTCLCGVLFFAWGYAFMFSHGNGFIGTHWFFLKDAPETYEGTGVALMAHWLFQFAFADTCSTITSGAMIGRTSWYGDLLYSFGVSGFIYPIIGHWAWGPDGFLVTMGSAGNFLPFVGSGFHDFAGSTVVHTIGGAIALAGAIVLGPRLGRKFKRDGGGAMLPHDLVIAASGGLILWFGWYGFNPGSTLSAMDFEGCGRVAANTTLAACSAGLIAMLWSYPQTKKWDLGFTVNGFLAGLVAITCPCYWVSPTGALLIGAVAGVVVVLAVNLMEWLRIDDPIGAVPVHMCCGIWGTWSLGLFATGTYAAALPTGSDPTAANRLAGLFYGGGTHLLMAQIVGNVLILAATFAVALALMSAVKMLGILRVSKEGELEGLDIHEHGIPAYPEYVLTPAATPHGAMNPMAATSSVSSIAAGENLPSV